MSFSPLLGNPKPQYEDSNGVPYVGMRLFFYIAGTSTKQNTYTDSTGGTPNTNPIVIDADGYPTSNVMIYGDDSLTYKVVAAPAGSDDPPTSPLWTIDNIYPNETLRNDLADTTDNSLGDALIGVKLTAANSTATTVHAYNEKRAYRVTDFGADNTGSTDATTAIQNAIDILTTGDKLIIDKGFFKVSDELLFEKLWGVTIEFEGIILPDKDIDWSGKAVLMFSGIQESVIIKPYVDTFSQTGWSSKTEATLPLCGIMFRRQATGNWVVPTLGFTAGDNCQHIMIYQAYIKGWFKTAAIINCRAEGIEHYSCTYGGHTCPSYLCTANATQVGQDASTNTSTIQHSFNDCKFLQEYYNGNSTKDYGAVELYDAVRHENFSRCFFAMGGATAATDYSSAIKLTQVTGQGGFGSINIIDCYGENVGNNFVALYIDSFDTGEVNLERWDHSQASGTTYAVVLYTGTSAHGGRPINIIDSKSALTSDALLRIEQDMLNLTIRGCRGIIERTSTYTIQRSRIELVIEDANASTGTDPIIDAIDYNLSTVITRGGTEQILNVNEIDTYLARIYNNSMNQNNVAFAASMTPDLANGCNIKFTLTGNATLENPANVKGEPFIIVEVLQDGTGGHVLTWGGAYQRKNNISTTANYRSLFMFIYNSNTNLFYECGSAIGY